MTVDTAKKPYKTLVFDVDDTLIIDKTSIVQGLKEVLAERGIEYVDDHFEQWVKFEDKFWDAYRANEIIIPSHYDDDGIDEHGRSRRHWVRAQRLIGFLPDHQLNLKEAYELLDLYESAKSSVAEAYADGVEIIDYLSTKYTVIAATDEVHDIAVSKLKLAGYDKITDVFSPVTTGHLKPTAEFFDSIFEKFGDNKDDYLMIGNSLRSDIQLAENIGIDSCLYNSWRESDFRHHKPTFVIDKLSDLKDIL